MDPEARELGGAGGRSLRSKEARPLATNPLRARCGEAVGRAR